MSKKWKIILGILAAVVIVAGITASIVRRVTMRGHFQAMMESRELPEEGRAPLWDRMRIRPGMFPGGSRGFTGIRPRIGGIAPPFMALPVLAVGTLIGLAVGVGGTLALYRRKHVQPEETN